MTGPAAGLGVIGDVVRAVVRVSFLDHGLTVPAIRICMGDVAPSPHLDHETVVLTTPWAGQWVEHLP